MSLNLKWVDLMDRKSLKHLKGIYFHKTYVGGHHEVFCNGKKHLIFFGDGYGNALLRNNKDTFTLGKSKCNCKEYGRSYG